MILKPINNLLVGIFGWGIFAGSFVFLSIALNKLYFQPKVSLFPSDVNRSSISELVFLPSPSPSSPPQVLASKKVAVQKQNITGITETELWQALVNYRASHNSIPLVHEESLCVYGRKRLAEHQLRLKETTDPNSVLDNHLGFQRDADSGSLFTETNFNFVSEVLAFIPDASNAVQVIEWGWDSSPEHREGLLSNEMTHGCIVGIKPLFVGILGRR